MEDELDDRILYQTYVSHMRLMSRIAWGLPLNVSPLAYTSHLWRVLKMYFLKPEILLFGMLLLFVLFYMQVLDAWSRTLLGRLQHALNRGARTKADKLALFGPGGDPARAAWETLEGPYAAYAVQGRRPKMEDRFVVERDINGTGVTLVAVFDGHGGEFAANYAKDNLVRNLVNRVIEIKDLVAGKKPSSHEEEGTDEGDSTKPVERRASTTAERRKSFKKTSSTTDECNSTSSGIKEITDTELLTRLENITRPITREVRPSSSRPQSFKKIPSTSYFDGTGTVNYGKLLTDEVLAADQRLLESAKKTMDVAGTTALIAILEGSKLVVANVGDSRGVMCDGKGNAIPLSFDHKPQQMREKKRIKEAGGFVTFNGVWRVAGILATSRALGDYPLKDRKLVIADPDILTFDLKDHKPMFVVLASDGLWDTFSNEEAVAFIKERLNEPDFGAKSLTLQSYFRGSLDNITVIVINFRDGSFAFHSSEKSST